MFVAYGMYRSMHPHEFHQASGELNVVLGVINTIVLLTSSLTMVLSIVAIRLKRKAQSMLFLASTMVLRLRLPGEQVLRVAGQRSTTACIRVRNT
jgi:cytochrome c oxidase subunit 3